ncbi:DUF445 family protein [Clostridium sp.]|uniref:DUF445 domain-containing protein n=1 Tax=Clostridium sp. TaxID=1506 RepID=UPI002638EF3F|nr:DUF445 family protein [Clostridium sp.]
MRTLISITLAVIIGGLIGWITNILAIKLLFRPLNPIKIPILNFEIWGLIPKRKKEIATNIGEVVSTELLSIDDIVNQAFKAEDKEDFNTYISDKIKNVINEKLEAIPITFRMMAGPFIDDILNKEVPSVVENIGSDLIDKIKDKVEIEKIVEDKINELDLLKLEDIILKVAKKELTQIEYWGLFLGATIGLIQGLLGLLI